MFIIGLWWGDLIHLNSETKALKLAMVLDTLPKMLRLRAKVASKTSEAWSLSIASSEGAS